MTSPTNPDNAAEPNAPDTPDDIEGVDVEPEPEGGIGWRKGLIIVLAVVVVWTIVQTRRRTGWDIEWSNDLGACLTQAQEQRKAVVLLVHKRDCPLMKDLDRSVFNVQSTYKWAMGGLPCRLIWEEHPEVVARYHLRVSPSLLVLSPQGKPVFEWAGEMITLQVRKRFLRYAVGHKDDATYRKETPSSGPAQRPP